ncbi:hypothetical protein DFJ73DRAFT_913909 [Zopfochytrium polystomum]|nr:hypothetical protein DFJ73DRAFT_913909 [Zopfochytrium polystomum]
MRLTFAIAAAVVAMAATTTTIAPSSSAWAAPDARAIHRDVLIIGGGGSGVYPAVRLRDDYNKTVALVEAQPRLGGHVETYVDAATGKTYDHGVIYYHNNDRVKAFFARLNVTLGTRPSVARTLLNLDAATGQPVRPATFTGQQTAAALASYQAQLEKYPFLGTGFDLPSPVPAELLQPFGEYAAAHGLDAFALTLFSYGQGLGDFLRLPALYVLKLVGLDDLQNIRTGFLSTAAGDNQALYDRAREHLGEDNVFLSTRVVKVERTRRGVKAWVQQEQEPAAAGQQRRRREQIIHARALLVAVPPTESNLGGFLDLTAAERAVFSQLAGNTYSAVLVNDTGLPDGYVFRFVGANNATSNVPSTYPLTYTLRSTGLVPGLMEAKSIHLGTDVVETVVRATVTAVVAAAQDALGVPRRDPNFVVVARHAPFALQVSADEIAAGFYANMTALQGTSRTVWTGAAWHAHDSSELWKFADLTAIPKILEVLNH